MKRSFTKWVAIAMIGVSSVAFTGCFGSFGLTTKLHNWNSSVSSAKFVNELVFLGMCILPVYEFAVLGDLLIFNTIEFWDGTDPLSMAPGEVEESSTQYAGETYTVTKSLNKVSITNDATALTSEFQYFPEEEAWYLMDGQEKAQFVKSAKKMMKMVYKAN